MRVVVTGTPGTGKTTATDLLDAKVVHLNDIIDDHDLWTERDEQRGSLVADLDAVVEWIGEQEDIAWHPEAGAEEVVVVESHLAHRLDADRVVVLRCAPGKLEDRLVGRGDSTAKARENAESEALDVILSEAFERHGAEKVYEIDTTGESPETVAAAIEAVIRGEREPSAGTVDFVDYLGEPGFGAQADDHGATESTADDGRPDETDRTEATDPDR